MPGGYQCSLSVRNDSLAPIVPDYRQPLTNELVADVAPAYRHPAKTTLIPIHPGTVEFGWLAQDNPQTVSGSISRRWIASLAPRATGKLRSVYRATGGYEADLRSVTKSQAVSVVDVGQAQGEGFKHQG